MLVIGVEKLSNWHLQSSLILGPEIIEVAQETAVIFSGSGQLKLPVEDGTGRQDLLKNLVADVKPSLTQQLHCGHNPDSTPPVDQLGGSFSSNRQSLDSGWRKVAAQAS